MYFLPAPQKSEKQSQPIACKITIGDFISNQEPLTQQKKSYPQNLKQDRSLFLPGCRQEIRVEHPQVECAEVQMTALSQSQQIFTRPSLPCCGTELPHYAKHSRRIFKTRRLLVLTAKCMLGTKQKVDCKSSMYIETQVNKCIQFLFLVQTGMYGPKWVHIRCA